MASYLDKTKVNTAITDNTKLDLGHQHISTMDFFQLNVANIQELVPGTKLSVNMETFARLNPLVVPTFGRASIRNRAFFVPFRTIYRGWNDFITDSVHIASNGYTAGSSPYIQDMVPYTTMEDLCHAFIDFIGSSSIDGNTMVYQVSGSTYDITWTFGGTTAYYNYTVLGRQALKLLQSLGYQLDWQHPTKDVKLNAMPFLALAKIWCDWYYPQQYGNRIEYDILMSWCNYDVNSQTGIYLDKSKIQTILQLCSWAMYDSDLFVSAWDQPNSPNAGNYSNFKLVNVDTATQLFGNTMGTYTENGYITNNSGTATSSNHLGGADAPFIVPGLTTTTPNGSNFSVTPVSEYLLHSLHALTDYMKRHQLAGSRAMDRYLARFGKALSAEKLNRSLYLGSNMQNVMIGDVMSTSDTLSSGGQLGAQLGTFAGKGISHGQGTFEFSTDEFGYFIIISTLIPATGYFQGIDPMVDRKTKLEFWTPEFENLGVEAIKASNLYIPQLAGQMTSGDPYQQIFGYVPRYAAYKAPTCMDRLTGNFRLPSIQGGAFVNAGNSWHLMRTFEPSDFNNDYANCVHNPQFIMGAADASQYKRLFYNDEPDAPDNFTVIHNFEIAEYAPMKPLYDTYEFEDKGKKVTLETNGVKLN